MITLEQTAIHFVTFGGGLCLMMALGRFIKSMDKNNDARSTLINRISALILLCNGNFIAPLSLYKMLYLSWPLTVYLVLPMSYAAGPLNLFYYNSLVNPHGLSVRKLVAHCIPAIIVFLADTALQFSPFPFHRDLLHSTIIAMNFTPLTAVIIGAVLHSTAYMAYLVYQEILLSKDDAIRGEMIIISVFNSLGFLVIMFNGIALLFRIPQFFLAAGIVMTLIHMGIFIESSRSPQFFQLLRSKIQDGKYRISTLRGVDSEAVLERLRYLLDTEKIFTDYDITLNQCARTLSLTPHQLSELINDKMGVNFRSMINQYRIEEACRLLQVEENANIIGICFKVGFSSKSAFNAAFRKFIGYSPGDFRSMKQKKGCCTNKLRKRIPFDCHSHAVRN